MQIEKVTVDAAGPIPLIAAFPYRVVVDDVGEGIAVYDAETQLTRFAGRRDFSTCREDESIWSIFSSKSDTKKDD